MFQLLSIKRLILFGSCVFMAVAGMAKTYRIAYLNSPSIDIGGKNLKTGDTFDSGDEISWKSPRQAMKVVDISSGVQSLMVAEKADKSKSRTLEEYLVNNKRMSSRDGMPDNLITLKTLIEKETHYLMDSLEVATAIPTDESHFFYVSYDYNGEEINKRITNSDGHFFITPDIFTIDGNGVPPHDVVLSLFYFDMINQRVSLVTDRFTLWVLTPEE